MTPILQDPPRPYKLELDAFERRFLIILLGNSIVAQGGPTEAERILNRLIDHAPVASPPAPPIGPGKETAAAILSPPPAPVLTDRWIKKKPEVFDAIEAPITKIEEKTSSNGPYLKITWPNQGRGFSSASVWDEALFGFVKGRLNQRTLFYLVQSGKYLNVAGVRA